MVGWFSRLFDSRPTVPLTATNSLPVNAIRLALDRDYRGPVESPYSDPSEVDTFCQAHRVGWEFFAQGSYSYLEPGGRPNGEVLGQGACERVHQSATERAGFTAGFDQAMKLHFQRVREAIQAHFAGAVDAEPNAAADGGHDSFFESSSSAAPRRCRPETLSTYG